MPWHRNCCWIPGRVRAGYMGLGGGRRLTRGPETSWQEWHASCSGQAGIGPSALGRVSLGWEHAQLIHSQGERRSQQRGGSLRVGILFRRLPVLMALL